jgi:hypothetical protein
MANENQLEKIQAKVIIDSINSLEFLDFACLLKVTTEKKKSTDLFPLIIFFTGPVNRFYFVLMTKNIFSPCSDVNYCVVWLKISQISLKSLLGVHLYCS